MSAEDWRDSLAARVAAAIPGAKGPGETLAWVNDYVGVPYKPGGRDRLGWDCWGLVMAVYREQLGVELPDWQWEPPFGIGNRVRAFAEGFAKASNFNARELEAAHPWAIALVINAGAPHHVGVVVGDGVLHAARQAGTQYDPLHRFAKSYPGVTWWLWPV